MGFSLSASFAILGTSIIVVIEIFSATMIPDTQNIYNSFHQHYKNEFEKSQTAIEITDATVTPNGSNYDYSINLSNIGSYTICLTDCIVLIDGLIRSFSADKIYVFPLNNSFLSVENISGTGGGRIKVVTKNDVESYYSYQV
jgi:archaellum component FlaF (FlaF/FlaG flagellin family)